MVSANRKMGQKRGQKGVKKARKWLFWPLFDHFSTFFNQCGFWVVLRNSVRHVWRCGLPEKKIGVGILRYAGSKSGIFEAFRETQGTKVWVATGKVRCPFPIPVLTTFLVIFRFAVTLLALQRSDQTSKMADFDSVYPNKSPIFQKFFGSNKNFG